MLTLAAVLSVFVYGMIAAMLGTILPDLSSRFSLSPKQNSTIATTQALGLMAASLIVGPLMDLQGKKVGLVLGLALVAISMLGLRKVSGYGAIAAFMLVLGLGGGIIVVAGNALPGDIDPNNQESVTNLVNLFFGLGGLVTPLVAARLFKNNTARLMVFGASIAVVTLAVCGMAPIAAPSGNVGFEASKVTELLGQKTLFLPALFLFLYVACEVGVWNWLVRHLIAQGVPEAKALTILSLGFALGLLIGRVAVSQVLKYLPVTPAGVLLAAAVFMAVTTFLMLQTKSSSTAWLLVFLAGVAMAPVFPTTLGIVGRTYRPLGLDGTAIGLAATAGWLGLVASSPIIGGIAGDDPKGLRKALLIIPTASVLMAVVSLAL